MMWYYWLNGIKNFCDPCISHWITINYTLRSSWLLILICVHCFWKNVIGVLEATRTLAFTCFAGFKWRLKARTPMLLRPIIIPGQNLRPGKVGLMGILLTHFEKLEWRVLSSQLLLYCVVDLYYTKKELSCITDIIEQIFSMWFPTYT